VYRHRHGVLAIHAIHEPADRVTLGPDDSRTAYDRSSAIGSVVEDAIASVTGYGRAPATGSLD